AIFGRQQFRLRQNSNFWAGDIERLCADIEVDTGIKSRKIPLAATPCEHVICRLDRNAEIGSVKQRFSAGDRMFIAYGGKRSGFRYFAIRCALEAVRDVPGSRAINMREEAPRVEALQWCRFCDPEDSQTRRATLMGDIATNVFTDAARDGPALESWIRSRIQKNLRPTIVYSTVVSGSTDDSSRINEWFGIWREILVEDRSRTIAVILFMESGWWPWSGLGVARLAQGGHLVRPSLGKVRKDHLRDWLNADVQRVPDESLRQRLHHVSSRLYRF